MNRFFLILTVLILFCKSLLGQITILPSSNNLCIGETLIINTNVVIDEFSYRWQDSTNYGWNDISNNEFYYGADSTVLTVFGINDVFNGRKFRCLYDRTGDNTWIDTSNVYEVSVYTQIHTGIIGNNQIICYYSLPSTIFFTTNPIGGGDVYTYQWQVSIDSLNFIDIIDSTQNSLTPSNLMQKHFYRAKVISTIGCGVDTTNIITVDVYNPFNQGSIIGNDTICYSSDANNIVFDNSPQGGDLSFQYEWLKSDDNLNWITTAQTNNNYTPIGITTSIFYKVKVTSNCGVDSTNSIFIKVWDSLSKASIVNNQFICYNTIADTIRIVQQATGGNQIFNYQWQTSINGSTWSNFNGENEFYIIPESLTSSAYFKVLANSTFGCGSITSDSVLIFVYPQINSGIIGNNQKICYNTVPNSIFFISNPVGGGDEYSYQWQVSTDSLNFIDIIDSTRNSLNPSNLIQKHFYRAKVISTIGCGIDTTNIITVDVYNPFNQGSIIGNDTICYNGTANSIYFNETPTGGDLSYQYQWLISVDNINWTNISNTTDSHTPMNLINSKYYREKVTSNCGEDYTNSVYIKVWEDLSKSIIGNNQSICYGSIADTINVTQEASGGNDIFNYQWQKSVSGNLWSDINNENSLNLVSENLSSSMYYRILATSDFGCGSIVSDSILIYVYPQINAGIIGNSQNICYNTYADAIDFINMPTGAGNLFNYQWQYSLDSLNYFDIIDSVFNTLSPSSLTQTHYYRAKVTSTLGCSGDTSNTIKVKVYALFATGTITGNDTICYNTTANTVQIQNLPSGGDSTYNYQWLTSLNGISWSSISGQTNSDYIPGTLNTSTFFKLKVTSNCGIDSTNSIKIHVWPNISKAIIGQSQSICYNTEADTLEIAQVATGGNGFFTYQWQNSLNGTLWNNLNGQVGETLRTGVLSISNYYHVLSTSLFGCGTVASDSIKITVYPIINSGAIASNQNICYNSAPNSLNFNTLPSGGGNSYSYQWQYSTDSINYFDANLGTNPVFSPSILTQTHYYRAKVISTLGCSSDTSNIIKIRVYAPFVAGTITGNDTICWDQNPNIFEMALNAGGGDETYTYQWIKAITPYQWSNVVNGNNTALNINNLRESTYYKLVFTSGSYCGKDSSNTIFVLVNPLPDTVLIYGESSICNNSSNLTYNFTEIYSGYNYNWTSNNINILGGENSNQIVVNAPNYSVFDTLYLTQQINATGCLNIMKYPVWITPNSAPNKTVIIRKSNTNILVCADSSAGIKYQWGYTRKSDEQVFEIAGANLRYVQLPMAFDTTQYIYWVKTWFEYSNQQSCDVVSYFNDEPFPISIDENDIKSMEILVYPNPCSTYFIIKLNSKSTKFNVLLFNINGDIVLRKTVNNNANKIDLPSDLPSGLYVLKIMNGFEMYYSKLTIIK